MRGHPLELERLVKQNSNSGLPRFRVHYTDAHGKPGCVDVTADTPDEASQRVRKSGLRITKVKVLRDGSE